MAAEPSPPRTARKRPPQGAWWQVLVSSLGLYFVGLGLLILTSNPNLFPTVVMIGSFTVPAAYVAFFYQRRHLSVLNMPTTIRGFLYGGILGVFAASLLEPIFVGSALDPVTALVVGLIEESVKVLGVLWIARHLRHDSELDGIILGAAAGMGFAALESTGYAFTAFLESRGSLSAIVAVTLMRGLTSPLGHGTWTAILVGVLFRESGPTHFRINLAVLGAYLTVVVLHALWDGLPAVLSPFVSSGIDIFIAQMLVGVAGLFILWRRWQEATQLAQRLSGPEGAAQ